MKVNVVVVVVMVMVMVMMMVMVMVMVMVKNTIVNSLVDDKSYGIYYSIPT